MTSTRDSRLVVSTITRNRHGWGPTINASRLVVCGCIRLEGLRFPRKLSAYHEAAHAVVARKLGCTVGHVNITAETVRGGECVHVTPDTYRVPGSRRIRGTPFRQETTQRERVAMARRQRSRGGTGVSLAAVALEDIARAVPALDLLPTIETLNGITIEGQHLRSRSDIRQAADAAGRQHGTDAGRDQFFRRARARAARLLVENWPSLTAVAEATPGAWDA